MVNVHPYADPYVAAGQGTIGLEILEDLPEAAAVVCPIGGGGLCTGVSTLAKLLNRRLRLLAWSRQAPTACRYPLRRERWWDFLR